MGADRRPVALGGSGRAAQLAAEAGGDAASSEELAARADVVFLCHKPKQLAEVAAAIEGFDGTIVSVLAATPLAALRDAYPEATVVRTMPNIPVEYGEGVFAVAAESDDAPELDQYFQRLGTVVVTPESQFGVDDKTFLLARAALTQCVDLVSDDDRQLLLAAGK